MKLILFRGKEGYWRIRLKAANGRILMSSEAYSKKDKARKTAESISVFVGEDLDEGIRRLEIKEEKWPNN